MNVDTNKYNIYPMGEFMLIKPIEGDEDSSDSDTACSQNSLCIGRIHQIGPSVLLSDSHVTARSSAEKFVRFDIGNVVLFDQSLGKVVFLKNDVFYLIKKMDLMAKLEPRTSEGGYV